MSREYTTKTAALKATTIDTRILDAKKIMVYPGGGDEKERKDILDVIKDSIEILDSRGENATEYDVWGTWVEKTEDGKFILHDDYVYIDNMVAEKLLNCPDLEAVTTIADNKLFDIDGNVVLNFQFDNLQGDTSGDLRTLFPNVQTFSANLDNCLFTAGTFCGTIFDGNGFVSNLPNLGAEVVTFAESGLKKFDSNLQNLKVSCATFAMTPQLKTFSSSLDNLQAAYGMFAGSSIESFSSYVPKLYDGQNMFRNSNIRYVDASFSNLLNGAGMFENTNLSLESVRKIAESLPVINIYDYDEEGNKVFIYENGVEFKVDLDEVVDLGGEQKFIIYPDWIGEMMITWKDPEQFTKEEKAVIIHEYFALMLAKGWTVITNLMEGEPDGIY